MREISNTASNGLDAESRQVKMLLQRKKIRLVKKLF